MEKDKKFKRLRTHSFVTFEENGVGRRCTLGELENVMNDLQDRIRVMSLCLNELGYELIYDKVKEEYVIIKHLEI